MTSKAGCLTCPVLGSCCHGDAKSCVRILSIRVPRSEMIVITGAALRLSSERKIAFLRYSACWLCRSSKLLTWKKEVKAKLFSIIKGWIKHERESNSCSWWTANVNDNQGTEQ